MDEFGEPDLGNDFYGLEDLPTKKIIDDAGQAAFAITGMTYLPVNSKHSEMLKEALKHTAITFLIEPNYKSEIDALMGYLQSDDNRDLVLLGLYTHTGDDVHYNVEAWDKSFVLDKVARGDWYIVVQSKNGLRTAPEVSEYLLQNNIEAMSAICDHATRQRPHDERMMASIRQNLSPLLDDDTIERAFGGYPLFSGMKKLSLSSQTLSRYATKIGSKKCNC